MRGNEEPAGHVKNNRLGEFQIPMRGNEIAQAGQVLRNPV